MLLENNNYFGNMTSLPMESSFLKIHKSALKFLVPLTLNETYKLVAEEARKLVGANYGSILLEEKGKLIKVYSYPEIFYQVKNRKNGFMNKVFHSRKPLILDISDYGSVHPLYKRMKVKTSIGVPLSHNNKPIGVLTLHSLKKSAFSSQDVLVLKLFAAFAALAIKRTQLYDEVEKALASRDHFISMASHELKTPITTIHGYIQLLKTRRSKVSKNESSWLEDLSGEMSRLINLVNELLAVERIKSGKISYVWRQCSLRGVVARAIASFKFTHPEHQISFDDNLGEKPDLVIGDFDRLLQVLANLLENGAKFSLSRTLISMSLVSKKSFLILTIQDQGQGIPKKDLPQIFNRFYKGQNHNREGMGLGLYLAKEIITEHKGTIKVISDTNKGTTVKIYLPEVKNG